MPQEYWHLSIAALAVYGVKVIYKTNEGEKSNENYKNDISYYTCDVVSCHTTGMCEGWQ
jgi:hypothetical protein